MRYNQIAIHNIIDEIAMGPFGSNIKVDCFVNDGVPVLNGSNLEGYKLKEDSFRFVTPEKAASLNKAVASRGDIVITHRGTLGQIALIPSDSKYEKYVISQSQFRIRCNTKKVLPLFLVYYFHTPEGQHKLLSNKSQVGVPALARPSSTFQNLVVPLPPLPEQRAITEILSCLDDKIELNNRINANLEAQAQAIFKSWFVDFKPFREEELIDSELGPIPKGWRVGKLGEIADITMGQSPNGNSYNEVGDGTVFYQGRAEFGWRFPTTRLYTTEPNRIAKKGDILMSVRAPVGDINIAKEDCCIGRGLSAIRSNSGMNSFVFYSLKSLKLKLDQFNGEGTVFGSINKNSLHCMEIIIPTNDIIRRFNDLCIPMDSLIFQNSEANNRLAAIRDALLPKLMSGEIDMSILEAQEYGN